jgi:hypothetical protein
MSSAGAVAAFLLHASSAIAVLSGTFHVAIEDLACCSAWEWVIVVRLIACRPA